MKREVSFDRSSPEIIPKISIPLQDGSGETPPPLKQQTSQSKLPLLYKNAAMLCKASAYQSRQPTNFSVLSVFPNPTLVEAQEKRSNSVLSKYQKVPNYSSVLSKIEANPYSGNNTMECFD